MDRIILKIIDEISIQRNVDLFSFHFPYLESCLEHRLSHLNLYHPTDYLDLLHENPNESTIFYFDYLYSYYHSDLSFNWELFGLEISKILYENLYQSDLLEIRLWIPNSFDKLTSIILSYILEDLKIKEKIQDYTIFITHPSKTTIERLRQEPIDTNQLPKFITQNMTNFHEYIEPLDSGYYKFSPKIRQKTIIANYDFLLDNPLKSLSIIFMNQSISIFSLYRQSIILRQIYEGLNPNGLLILPEKNFNPEFNNLFEPIIPNSSTNEFYPIFKKKNTPLSIPKYNWYIPQKYKELTHLTLSTQIQKLFFDMEEIGYIVCNEAGTILEISNDLSQILSIREGTFYSGFKISELLEGDLKDKLKELLAKSIRTRTSIRETLLTSHPKFQGKYNSISLYPFLDPKSRNTHYIFYFWNSKVGSEKENFEQMERTIREIHHRLRNQISILHSILQLESNETQSEETKEFIQSFLRRLKAMEIIQNRMSEAPYSLKVDLKSLLDDFIIYFNSELIGLSLMLPIEFSYNSGKIQIQSRVATSLLLSIFEISKIIILNLQNINPSSCNLNIQCNEKELGLSIDFLLQIKNSLPNPCKWIIPDGISKIIIDANNKQMNSRLVIESSNNSFLVSILLPKL